MKLSLLTAAGGIAVGAFLSTGGSLISLQTPPSEVRFPSTKSEALDLNQVDESGRLSCASFKQQSFCRAELPNFEFDVHFVVLAANVYFTGANFSSPVKAAIKSSSLESIKPWMEKCVPGTIVTFDDIKVSAPDGKVRTIQSVSYRLY